LSDHVFSREAGGVTPPGVVDLQGIRDLSLAEAERRLVDDGPIPGVSLSDWQDGDALQTYFGRFWQDLAKVEATAQILREFRPDFTAVYINLIDSTQHNFWRYFEPSAFGEELSPGDEGLDRLIPLSYEVADELLGRLLTAAPEDSSVIILSDHGGGPWVPGGFLGIQGLSFMRSFHPNHSGNHRLDGMLVMSGPQYRSGRRIGDTHQLDLVPTILNFFGLPIADDMPGQVLQIGLRAPNESEYHRVATYDHLRVRDFVLAEEESQVDDEIERQIKSLGYVQ
jgi:hypothetical protein